MLTGDAKTRYQRDYMRRKRAGQPTRTRPLPALSPRSLRRIERDQAEAPASRRCTFCGEPGSAERELVGGGDACICEFCIISAIDILAAKREAARRERSAEADRLPDLMAEVDAVGERVLANVAKIVKPL
jgi:ClpX C4-type zinc finger